MPHKSFFVDLISHSLTTHIHNNELIYFSMLTATLMATGTKVGATRDSYSKKFMSGKQTPEYKKIQENYDKLSTTLAHHVPPGDLANKLFAAHLIGEELKQESNREIVGQTTRINNLLAAVHNQIELNHKTFHKFINILEEYEDT